MAVCGHGLHVLDDFALIPYMISSGEDMSAQVEEIFGDDGRDTEASGRIFSIDDEKVDVAFSHHMRQMFAHDTPAGTAEDIAYKKNPQDEKLRNFKSGTESSMLYVFPGVRVSL